MEKFKVGDRVYAEYSTRKGIGVVEEVDTATTMNYRVKFESGERFWCYNEKVKPAPQFETGQWLRLKGDNDGYGMAGDVVKMIRYEDGTPFCGFFYDIRGRKEWFVKESLLEAWVPRVGERVRYTGKSKEYSESVFIGIEGVVRIVGGRQADVVWDVKEVRGYGTGGRKYFDNLEPVAPAAARTLRIEAGKFYRTSDGQKIGPMVKREYEDFIVKRGDGNRWFGNGKHGPCNKIKQDLISEWVDEPGVAVDDVKEGPIFKVGDRVRVTKAGNSGHGRRVGEEFTLASLRPGNLRYGKFWNTIEGVDFYLDEIELVDQSPQPQSHIVCLLNNGSPRPATEPFVHATKEAAEREANRLAGIHKGSEFAVFSMGAVAKVEKPAKVYAYEWQRLAAEGDRDGAATELYRLTGMKHSVGRYVADKFVS